MNNKINGIQVLRGVLFLLILAFHCNAPYANLAWGGVEAFFVLSSFFVVKKYYGCNDVSIREQFKRRLWRLYPPYLVVIFLAAIYALLRRAIPWDIIIHLTSTQNFVWMFTGYTSPMQGMTSHTWTLSIEVWTGLLWLVMLKKLSKKQFRAAMWIAWGAAAIYRIVTLVTGCNIYVMSIFPLAQFDGFACGSLLAIDIKEKRLNIRRAFAALSIGLLGLISTIVDLGKIYEISFIEAYKLLSFSRNYLINIFTAQIYAWISILSAGMIALILLKSEATEEPGLMTKVFIWLGDNSYALYLFHWPIYVAVLHIVSSWYLCVLIVFAGSVMAALAYSKTEKLIKERWVRRKSC